MAYQLSMGSNQSATELLLQSYFTHLQRALTQVGGSYFQIQLKYMESPFLSHSFTLNLSILIPVLE